MSGFVNKIFTSKVFKKRLRDIITIGFGGTFCFVGVNAYFQNEKFYDGWVMPALRRLDPEVAHNLALKAAKYKLFPKYRLEESKLLECQVFGLHFQSPVGLAAGFDKNGEAVEGLGNLGFGFVEVGSVTPEPQSGNPKPRVFRLVQDQAVINRCGFNSEGHEIVYERLSCLPPPGKRDVLLGVNLGKNKTSVSPLEDYTSGIVKFGSVADYLVINVSSPNTPGLRKLQGRDELQQLLAAVLHIRDNLPSHHRPPVLVKLAPDLSDEDKQDIAHVVITTKVDGLVVSNTTVTRPPSLQSPDKDEIGGLSGVPLRSLATSTIKDMYRLTNGKVPIIGVGGVGNGLEAYEKIRAGASLVQLYTGLIYHGPPLVSKITCQLQDLLRKDGFSNIKEAVGVDS